MHWRGSRGSSLPLQLPDPGSEIIFSVHPALDHDVLQEGLIEAVDGVGRAHVEALFAHGVDQTPDLRLDLPYLPISFRCSGTRSVPSAPGSMFRYGSSRAHATC